MKHTGVKLGKHFRLDKDGKPVRNFIPRDASQKARWQKKPQTVRVARHQKRGS